MGSGCSTSSSTTMRKDNSQLPRGVTIDPTRLDQPNFGSIPSSEHLTRVFERFARKNKTCIDYDELAALMTKLRSMYEKNKPGLVKELNVEQYDEEFFKLVLFALDDDSSGTIDVAEWKRWIVRGASMENSKRERWAIKDVNNSRLDIFLRSVLDACGTSVDASTPDFDTW